MIHFSISRSLFEFDLIMIMDPKKTPEDCPCRIHVTLKKNEKKRNKLLQVLMHDHRYGGYSPLSNPIDKFISIDCRGLRAAVEKSALFGPTFGESAMKILRKLFGDVIRIDVIDSEFATSGDFDDVDLVNESIKNGEDWHGEDLTYKADAFILFRLAAPFESFDGQPVARIELHGENRQRLYNDPESGKPKEYREEADLQYTEDTLIHYPEQSGVLFTRLRHDAIKMILEVMDEMPDDIAETMLCGIEMDFKGVPTGSYPED